MTRSFSCALFITHSILVELLVCIFGFHHLKNPTTEETLHSTSFHAFEVSILQPPFRCIFISHNFSPISIFTSSTQLGINEGGPFDLVWIIKGKWRLAYVLYRSLPRLIPLSFPFELARRVHGSGSEVFSVCRAAAFLLSTGFVAGDNWEIGEFYQIKFLSTVCHG